VRWLDPRPLPANTLPTNVDHTFGTYTKGAPPAPPGPTFYTYYNKQNGLATLSATEISSLGTVDPPITDPVTYFKFSSQAYVMNVGQAKGTSVGLVKSEFTLENGQLMDSGKALVDGIVFMDAQLGKAATAAATSVSYVRTMPATTTQDDWFLVRTVRVVLIARGSQYEKTQVSPASITVWDTASGDPYGQPVTYNIPANDRHYRHQVVQLVVPIRNMFWRP